MPQRLGASRRPAVCIVRHNYYPDGHVRRDAETLAEEGYDVSVIALRRPGQPGRETLNGVEVHRMPVEHRRGSVLRYVREYVGFFLLAFWTVTMLHLRKRFSIVEVDNMPDPLVFVATIPKLTGARVIFYIFDNMPDLLQVTRKVGPRHPAVRVLAALERVAAGFADRVIVTQETARQLMEKRGVAGHRLAVVLNCPDEALFKPTEPRPETPRNGRFEIVTHGAILERYGIQTLIEALPKIAAQIPGARVQVFGEGEYRSSLEALALRTGVADRVDFRGLVPIVELPADLRAADVGYVGMQCDLMLSNKLQEYVALGVPVVITRWPTYEHYFSDDCVSYFRAGDSESLADALIEVYRNPRRTQQRATRAARAYARYRWPVQRELYVGVYQELRAPATALAASKVGGQQRVRPQTR